MGKVLLLKTKLTTPVLRRVFSEEPTAQSLAEFDEVLGPGHSNKVWELIELEYAHRDLMRRRLICPNRPIRVAQQYSEIYAQKRRRISIGKIIEFVALAGLLVVGLTLLWR